MLYMKTADLIKLSKCIIDQDKFKELKMSIEREGIRTPILLIRIKENKYKLIDGHHRLAVASKLKIKFVPVIIKIEIEPISIITL